MKKKSNQTKCIILFIVILVIILIGLMIYKNLFGGINSSRLNGIENYKLTNNEINFAKDKINELDNVSSIDIYTNSKIIKIFIKLKDDVEFDKIEALGSSLIESFSKENLSYYDIELFIESNESSELYPKIGYKHKTNNEFVW